MKRIHFAFKQQMEVTHIIIHFKQILLVHVLHSIIGQMKEFSKLSLVQIKVK
jgi:hypothetical protein